MSARRTAIHDAVASVYARHDHNAPLNHVNVVEWVEAVEKALGSEIAVEITETLGAASTCKVSVDGVLRFSGSDRLSELRR